MPSNILGDKEKVVRCWIKANEPDILGLKIDYYGRARYLCLILIRNTVHDLYGILPAMELSRKRLLKRMRWKRIQCVPSDPCGCRFGASDG